MSPRPIQTALLNPFELEMPFTEEEKYHFEERLGILGVMGEPDHHQWQLAMDSVRAWRHLCYRKGQ